MARIDSLDQMMKDLLMLARPPKPKRAGIPREIREKTFTPFFTTRSAAKKFPAAM